MGDAADVCRAMRDAGCSIIGPAGETLTGSAAANVNASFETFLDNLCGKGSSDQSDVIREIKQAAADAAWTAEANKLGTTNPKCYSKAIATISRKCQVTITWQARDANEEYCGR
ncbi:MAG: hypothetical protein E6G97_00090 [Alphaproteobacteria bacterium]|nr:MAG: hypothetical protein E6G97_00090 [Alphaproteobacteria bacterium]